MILLDLNPHRSVARGGNKRVFLARVPTFVALLWGKRPTFANNCTSKVLICVHQSRGNISQIEETFIRCSTSVEKQCFNPPTLSSAALKHIWIDANNEVMDSRLQQCDGVELIVSNPQSIHIVILSEYNIMYFSTCLKAEYVSESTHHSCDH